MSEVLRPSLVSRSSVPESKLSPNDRAPNGFASETQTSSEAKTQKSLSASSLMTTVNSQTSFLINNELFELNEFRLHP